MTASSPSKMIAIVMSKSHRVGNRFDIKPGDCKVFSYTADSCSTKLIAAATGGNFVWDGHIMTKSDYKVLISDVHYRDLPPWAKRIYKQHSVEYSANGLDVYQVTHANDQKRLVTRDSLFNNWLSKANQSAIKDFHYHGE